MKINKENLFSIINGLIENNKKDSPIIIAIDGRAASGKTTFTKRFEKDGITVIHTDDFYRPKNANGKLEISEFDGNFDFNRFKSEVVDNLTQESFSYGVFDCSEQKIVKTVSVALPKCIIIEGTYSHNPNLNDYADLKVFFDIEEDIQKERIIKRNSESAYENFKKLWIQAEERYFNHYGIKQMSDFIVTEENNGHI
jgi:uridine kinase